MWNKIVTSVKDILQFTWALLRHTDECFNINYAVFPIMNIGLSCLLYVVLLSDLKLYWNF
jgi:hypothetical protein